ncbi:MULTISPECIES: aspartyl-phosphate phosphatase Spo0E family protein [Paenibacillus]|uniref:Aspartyl-phosphate phosphatase Spo0E family protein n=1 Tax=Paenibacillus alvei TaxID=44250 RepID=A0ABT4EKL2_PAEAL|nr:MULTISPECIES: aspartyl-phosphate phosphatase Spo0E family protein [Paenibacillus]MCY9533168.1 aspartyl-phosphate phosphatase Spo0E family protein [Paenibacillus alvei]SDF94668.1 Spo0E like sporulation regulatory protein [Paenibacillus sp. cl6col]
MRFYFDIPTNETSLSDEMLLDEIEKAREQLQEAFDGGKTFTDAEVIELSQQLDEYLVEIQKKRLLKKAIMEIDIAG